MGVAGVYGLPGALPLSWGVPQTESHCDSGDDAADQGVLSAANRAGSALIGVACVLTGAAAAAAVAEGMMPVARSVAGRKREGAGGWSATWVAKKAQAGEEAATYHASGRRRRSRPAGPR